MTKRTTKAFTTYMYTQPPQKPVVSGNPGNNDTPHNNRMGIPIVRRPSSGLSGGNPTPYRVIAPPSR